MARVGVLGGTFNPPHLGHLALARHAREELELAAVYLMPAQMPPHKRPEHDPGGERRLAMCRLLVGDAPEVSVCALELERAGPSYTVDTLARIHTQHPHAQLTFIAGTDTARTIPTWREPTRLLALANLAVAARAGTAQREVLAALEPLGAGGAVSFLKAPPLDVSSSRARACVARGEAIDALVGAAVASYIKEHHLYRPPLG